jgi:hypothetical protein
LLVSWLSGGSACRITHDMDHRGVQGCWQCARDIACRLPELEAPLSSRVLFLTGVTMDLTVCWSVMLCNWPLKPRAIVILLRRSWLPILLNASPYLPHLSILTKRPLQGPHTLSLFSFPCTHIILSFKFTLFSNAKYGSSTISETSANFHHIPENTSFLAVFTRPCNCSVS